MSTTQDLSGIPDEIKALIGEAEDAKRGGDGPPVVYLPKGNTKLRFYMDPAGKFTREFYRYYFGIKTGIVDTDGKEKSISMPHLEGSPIDTLQSELVALDYGFAWKYKAQQQYMSYAWIISSDEKSDDKMKLNELVICVFNWKVYNQIMTCVRDFSPQVTYDMFNHDKDMNVWTINFQGGQGGNVSVAGDMSITCKLPPLPEETPPLTNTSFFPAGAPQKPEDVALVCSHMRKLIASIGSSQEPNLGDAAPTSKKDTDDTSSLKTPWDDDSPAPPATASAQEPTPSTQAPAPDQEPTTAPASAQEPTTAPAPESAPPVAVAGECPNSANGFAFGEPQMDPECVLCKMEKECKAASVK